MNMPPKNAQRLPSKQPPEKVLKSAPIITAPPMRAKTIAATDFQETFFLYMKTVMSRTTKGWRDAKTAALDTLVVFTAVNHAAKWPKRKRPDKKHQIRFFRDMEKRLSLISFLAKTGMRKKGSAKVSLQKPMAMDGADIRAPKEPDMAPQSTATPTNTLAYFAIKPRCSDINIFSQSVYSNNFLRLRSKGGLTMPFSVITAVMYLWSVTSKEGL